MNPLWISYISDKIKNMSAAKMVADSTQGDLDEPKKKRKRKKENLKKKPKKLKKRDSRKGKVSRFYK